MKLKKFNATLGLLTIVAMLLHIGYTVFTYLAFYYNPVLKTVFSLPFMILTCVHAVCGMAAVFLQADGTRLDLYPKRNLRTILQRMSAALIFPLLILHINTFNLLSGAAEGGNWLLFGILIASQPLFYGVVMTHIATSLSRALITLGWLSSGKTQTVLDRIVYGIGAVCFLVSTVAVVRTQLMMFLS